MASELEQEMMSADEQVNDDEFYAYVIITANGMGNDACGADECNFCGEKIEWDYVDYSDTPGWVHKDTEQALCAAGGGEDAPQCEPGTYKHHHGVFMTLPESVRSVLVKTDDTEFGEDVSETYEVETKWAGWLNKAEWEALKNDWGLDPERSDRTMGMITEMGLMWALSETHDGMDWNMGGYTHLDYMNIYYCSQDPDVMKVAKEYGYFGDDDD